MKHILDCSFTLCISLYHNRFQIDFGYVEIVDQCFSTTGSRPTFGSLVLTFGAPKPVFYYYDCNIWVAKFCIFLFYGLPLANYQTLRTTDVDNLDSAVATKTFYTGQDLEKKLKFI